MTGDLTANKHKFF